MVCPYCRTPIDADPETQKLCEGCRTPHHVECFAENGGCTLFGCKFAPPDEPKVQVASGDVARAIAFGQPPPVGVPRILTGFGDIQAPLLGAQPPAPVPAAMSLPPPPPPPPPPLSAATVSTGATAAVTAPVVEAQASSAPAPVSDASASRFFTPGGIFDAAPDASGQMVANRHPKSRLAYILLGLTLGVFGAHNFYAGYRTKAAIQFSLTVFTFLYASPITLIWAVVEVCTVEHDADRVEFS